MLASMHPFYASFNDHATTSSGLYDNLDSPIERTMPTAPAAATPASSSAAASPLYTAIIPRKQPKEHDPTQPSTSNCIPIPPNLTRIVNAPLKSNFNKLRLCLKLSPTDASNPKIAFEETLPTELDALDEPQFSLSIGANKLRSDQSYHTVFPVKTTQSELCTSVLPELLHTVFSGHDASLMYFGAISRHKQDLLYSRIPGKPSTNGVFVSSIQWIFRLVDEYRLRKKDVRYSIRVSALHYSQKTDSLIDLLADFCPDAAENGGPVCTDDPALGVTVEGRSEVRVETVDQTLCYLDRVYDHRVTEDEDIQRSSHTFFYLTLYRYQSDSSGLQSGKSRLCLIDLGLGEKNSKSGYMTMPVLGNILLAIFQGQKHLPSRQNTLCRLLKESLGSAKNKTTTLLSTFAPIEGRCPIETENLMQLASKMHKATRRSTASPGSRRGNGFHTLPPAYKSGNESSASSELLPRPVDPVMEYTSSSEQSCAETVIFLGGNQHQQPVAFNGAPVPHFQPHLAGSPTLHKRSSRSSRSSRHSNGSHGTGTPEPSAITTGAVIPIDCPPNAIVHASASLHSLSLTGSPKRPPPAHLLHRTSGSMPGTPTTARAPRQTSVPTDLILCNPMARTSSPKHSVSSGSLKRSTARKENIIDEDFFHIDPEKREMVLHWVMEQKVEYGADVAGIGRPLPSPSLKVDTAVQCNEDEIDSELFHVWNAARVLDDIVEDDEEPSISTAPREALAPPGTPPPTLTILTKKDDLLDELNLLALERLAEGIETPDDGDESEDDEELERAMAASMSSMKSHEILTRMVTDFNSEPPTNMADSFLTSGTDTKPPTDTDFYRRASHLEAYAVDRLREMQNLEEEKKENGLVEMVTKVKNKINSCIEPNTISVENSVSEPLKSVSATMLESKQQVLKPVKDTSLLSKFKLKHLSCCNTMTTSSTSSIGTNTENSSFGTRSPLKNVKVAVSKPELAPEVEQQLKNEIRNAGLGLPPNFAFNSASMPRSQSSTSSPVRQQGSGIPLPAHSLRDLHTSTSLPMPTPMAVSTFSRKSTASKSTKRRGSAEAGPSTEVPPSPYTKVTPAVPTAATYSSGHGSDDTCSNPGQNLPPRQPSGIPVANGSLLAVNSKNRPRNRESFSASSGYESADYGKYRAGLTSPNGIQHKKLPATTIIAQNQVKDLRLQRDSLKQQLSDAKRRLGLDEEVHVEPDTSYVGLAPEVQVDLLRQETHQLEKRLIACRNRVMLVTTFL
uniref:Kinesin motor domain-containing protein n=1 Tax=Panagrellus redivivus TaxID=6233 RepID=A0A7E4VWU2_PANRE